MEIVRGGVVSKLLEGVPIPRMFRAEQIFPRPLIKREDVLAAVWEAMAGERVKDLIKPGMNIAITAGSRGIANVDVITKAIVDFVKKKGAHPFIVPAMGSHGGATAEGQLQILEGYNITEERMGCPIRSSMETVLLGTSELGKPVYLDKIAYHSDGIIVSCRVKPHNAFRGPYESGFCKMMVVGLGKQEGAESVHSDGMGVIAKNLPANAKDGGVKVQRTCFLDLTEASHGNALGTGLASCISKRLFDKIDLQMMYPNTITNTVIRSAEMPIIMATDKESIQFCIRTLNGVDKEHARVIRIPNSLHIGKIMLSEAYYNDVVEGKYDGLKAIDEPQYMDFDEEGNLLTPVVL